METKKNDALKNLNSVPKIKIMISVREILDDLQEEMRSRIETNVKAHR